MASPFIHKLLTKVPIHGMKLSRGWASMNSEKIIQILRDKNATLPCPACGNEDFTLVDGDFSQEFLVAGGISALTSSPLGGISAFTSFPSSGNALTNLPFPTRRSLNYIVLVCDNCGYIRQHAVKPLGITPKYRRG
jgi:hypothetical protein